MQGTMLHGPRDIRFEDRPEPTITKPTDAIIRLSATCICGADLWPYRSIAELAQPTPMGHAKKLIPSLLATSDVLGTGWFAADAADVKTVVVVGDGAVCLLAVLSASRWLLNGSSP